MNSITSGSWSKATVSRVAQFGAFVSLDPGIEALLHTSQIAEPPPEDSSLVVHEEQPLLMRVISIEWTSSASVSA